MQSQDCAYAKYDSLVNIARGNFKDKKSVEGLRHLRLAFETSNFPRGEDLSYALYKARESKDDNFAIELAEKLSMGGIPKRFFFQFKKEKWFPNFDQNFQYYAKFYQDNFNHKLRKELLLLLDKDSKYNEKYHKWRAHEIEVNFDDLIYDAKEVLTDFEKIIIEYGFPSEKLTGYNYIKRTNKVAKYNIDVLMIHMYQRGVRLFENSIADLICSGALPSGFKTTIDKIYGFSSCYGIENEMKARYKKFREKNHK